MVKSNSVMKIMTNEQNEQVEEMDSPIKFALPQDITQIVAFGYTTFKENLLKSTGIHPSFEKMLPTITDWVMNHAVLVKRNEENDTYIDGVCAMQTSETWWSDDSCLFGTLLFIKPEKRSFKLVRDLLKAAQEYAIMCNIPLVLDLVDQRDAERKKKLLKYLGFNELGSLFIFTPNNTNKEQ